MTIRFSGDGIEQDGFATDGNSISVSIELASRKIQYCDVHEITYGDKTVAIRMREGGQVRCGTAFVRPMVAGTHAVSVTVENATGIVEQGEAAVIVLPPDSRCNAYPDVRPSFFGYVEQGKAAARIAELVADPKLAELAAGPFSVLHMGDASPYEAVWEKVGVALSPLRAPGPALGYVAVAYPWMGEWGPGRDVHGWLPACEEGPDQHSTIVEFWNPATGSFFYTGDATEMATIDGGGVGPWQSTGLSFPAVTRAACPQDRRQNVVYRFWGGLAGSPGAHFFTRNRSECQAVAKAGGWTFEGVAFWTQPVNLDGWCGGLVRLHRLWRPFGQSLHRLTTDPDVVAAMKAAGWVSEGPMMCVLPSW